MVQERIDIQKFPFDVMQGLIVLLHKDKLRQDFTNWRLITLLNIRNKKIYKNNTNETSTNFDEYYWYGSISLFI